MRKTAAQLATRRAGRVVAEMHDEIRRAIRAGVPTLELDAILDRRGARSNFLGYHGFPAVICIISVDCGAIVDGWHGDAAFTAPVGEIDEQSRKLIAVTESSLEAGIAQTQAGGRVSDIGHAVQLVAEGAGFSVVREYTGHGIGTAMHEGPDVPNHGTPGKGPKLRPGMVLAVEPMVNVGDPDTFLEPDGWTVRTADGSRSCHVEHSIAVTDHGPEILTLP